MNLSIKNINPQNFLANKRERMLSSSSELTRANIEDEEIPLRVKKSNSKYPDVTNNENFSIQNYGTRLAGVYLNQKILNMSNEELKHNLELGCEEKKTPQVGETKLLCNCKNSQCLKFYCECFSTMLYCDPKVCSCKNCMNNVDNESVRSNAIKSYFAKSPNSFKKILSASVTDKTPFSFFELNQGYRGCTCKKSFCLKKYCECYQGGFNCGSQCKCLDCKNSESIIKTLPSSFKNRQNEGNNTKTKCTIFSVFSNNDKEPFKMFNIQNDQKQKIMSLSQNVSIEKLRYKFKTEKIVPYRIIINNYRINQEYESQN